MSAVVIPSSVLRGIAYDIKPLIPKGQTTVPLRIALADGRLSFTVKGVCTYEANIKVNDDSVAEITTNYLNIADYLESNGDVTLNIDNTGIQIRCNSFTSFLIPAYSTVERMSLPDMKFIPFENTSLVSALHTLSSTGLNGLYKKEPPIEIYDKVAILKYPNIFIQTRAPYFSSNISITLECAKIIQAFGPKEYCVAQSDTVVFKKYDSLLAVPVKLVQGGLTIKDVAPTDGYVLRLSLGKFIDKLLLLRNQKVDRADVVLKEKGLSVSVSSRLSSLSVSTGDVSSNYVTSFSIPTALLCICFKLVGDALVEILYKGGTLCLRTPTIAIVVRVLS